MGKTDLSSKNNKMHEATLLLVQFTTSLLDATKAAGELIQKLTIVEQQQREEERHPLLFYSPVPHRKLPQ